MYRIVPTVTKNPYTLGYYAWGDRRMAQTPAELREAQLCFLYGSLDHPNNNVRIKGCTMKELRNHFWRIARQHVNNFYRRKRFFLFIMKNLRLILARGIKDGTIEFLPKWLAQPIND